jgi:hypothetical protein
MTKDQTCYNLSGLIEIFEFATEKVIKIYNFWQNKK